MAYTISYFPTRDASPRDENRRRNRKKKNNRYLYYLLFCLRASFKSDLRIIVFASANQAVRPYTENKNALYLFALCSTTMRNAVRESVVLECVTELYARCPHSSNEIRVHIPTVLHVPTKSTYSTRQYIELRID